MSKSKQLYEVRVREQVGRNKWVKKSKFWEAESPEDAALKYLGPGSVMWSKKASKEKLLGIGDFFFMGDKLLKEFSHNGNGSEPVPLVNKDREREKVRQKRFFLLSKKRKPNKNKVRNTEGGYNV